MTALVICRECAGTGNGPDPIYQCEYCLGGGHIAVDLTPDGGLPDQERPWCGPILGELPEFIQPD